MNEQEYVGTEQPHRAPYAGSQTVDVVVRDVEMKFGSMVMFLIKWTLASIPALIILSVLGLIVTAIFGGIFSGMM